MVLWVKKHENEAQGKSEKIVQTKKKRERETKKNVRTGQYQAQLAENSKVYGNLIKMEKISE